MPILSCGHTHHEGNSRIKAHEADEVEVNGLPRADIAEEEVTQQSVRQEERDEDTKESSAAEQGGHHCDEKVLKDALQEV